MKNNSVLGLVRLKYLACLQNFSKLPVYYCPENAKT